MKIKKPLSFSHKRKIYYISFLLICGVLLNTYADLSNTKLLDLLVNVPATVAGSNNINTIKTKVDPIADFTFMNDGACSGEEIQFTSDVTGTTGDLTYSWDFGDGSDLSIEENPTHAFEALGCDKKVFNVKLTVTDDTGSESITKIITVLEKPDVEFGDADGKGFNKCDNTSSSSADYEITVQNFSDAIGLSCVNNISIDWGDGTSSNPSSTFTTIPHTYTSVGSYLMKITAENSTNGCKNVKTYTVSNSSNLVGGFNLSDINGGPCAPVDYKFEISSWGENSDDTKYIVAFGDDEEKILTHADLKASRFYNAADPKSSANFPVLHTYTKGSLRTADKEYTATLTVTNACYSRSFTVSNITILEASIPTFEAVELGCINESILFKNTSQILDNPSDLNKANFTWNFGDGTIITTTTKTNISHTYDTPDTYTVILEVTGTCGTNKYEKEICIEPKMTPLFSVDNEEGCIPLEVSATNDTDVTKLCSIPTYLWTVTYAADNCGTIADWEFINGTDETYENPQFNFKTPGKYTLTQEITTACDKATTTKIIDVKKPPTVSINDIADICVNTMISPTATIENCTSDASEITYNWTFTGGSPANSTSLIPGDITYATPDTYTVTLEITSACGVVKAIDKTFEVYEVPVITNTDLTQEICSTESTSEITLNTDDSRTTFSWTATASSTDISGFTANGSTNKIPAQTLTNSGNSAGTVTYTAVPQLGGSCEGAPVDFVITVNPSPVITTQPISSEVCLNGTATLLEVAYEKGTGTPTYQWYSNTSDAYGGSLITDANNATFIPPTDTVDKTFYYVEVNFPTGGCSLIRSNIASVNVVQQITIDPATSPQIICEGGVINELEVSYTGGTGTATYQWFSNTTNTSVGGNPISGATNSKFTPSGLFTAGDYYYYAEINLTGNGCTYAASGVYEIIVSTPPVIDAQPLTNQEVCLNQTPTDLSVTASSGTTTTKNYQWFVNTSNSATGGTAITGANSTTYTPDTSTAGTFYYYVEVSQTEAGCSVTSDVSTLIVKPAPEITTQPTSYAICLGEAATNLEVDFINGTGNIQWYSNINNANTGGDIITGATSNSYTPAVTSTGTIYYYAEITFTSGVCSSILISEAASVTVNETPVIANANITISSKVPFIFNPKTIITNKVPTGTKYTWSTPTFSPAGAILGSSAETTPQDDIRQTLENTGTSPVIVTYTITPTTGTCSGTPFTLEVTVNSGIASNAVITNNSCHRSNDGAIEVTISGGTPFATGNPYIISWTGPNGFTSSATTITNLEAGDYMLTVRDDTTVPFTQTYTVTQPGFLEITTDLKTNISCFAGNTGRINVSISGGTAPYTYNWTTTDGSGIVLNAEDQNTLTAGTYNLEIIDVNNCTTSTSFTLSQPIKGVEITASKQDIASCFGDSTGAIDINVTGGTSPYSYNWTTTDGSGLVANAEDQNSLTSGTYNVTVTDNLGCSTNESFTINELSTEIMIAVTKKDIDPCMGVNYGEITVTPSGGQPPYSISWNHLANGFSLSNLDAGTYIATITDANNCTKEETIIITQPDFSINSTTITPIICNGDKGAISLVLNGGIGPITVTWDDDATAGLDRNNLSGGTYTVHITDSNPANCPIQRTFTIIDPPAIAISSTVIDDTDCNLIGMGSIDLDIAGGVAPYTFLWSNGETTEDVTNLSAGDYSVEITDDNGCSTTEYFNIFRQDPLSINFEEIVTPDCDLKTVSQTTTAKVTGGFLPYTYTWSAGTVSDVDNSIMTTDQNGAYTLTITDAKGCTESQSILIDLPSIGDIDFNYNSFTLNEYNLLSIQDPIQFTNLSTGNYTNLSWDFGDGTPIVRDVNPTHTYDKVGTFTVTLKADFEPGCTVIQERVLNITKGYLLVSPTAFTPNNDGYNETIRPSYRGLIEIEMTIYNTWGIAIYYEKDINLELKGWDGTIKGKLAENGNYIMLVKGLTFYNTEITSSTPITLIK
ncbi:PKD domain-containing protein [Polaribacter staleyi]|uniref:PKD domain-containing protein n=1 Tax=Polaribacter staleyi TaxID=2022337 RepID=UPI0031BB0C88